MRKLFYSYFTLNRKHLRNKYFLLTVAFLIWMFFFDRNGFPVNHSLSKSIDKLENVKADYIKKIKIARATKLDLEMNKEKFAREKYLMHKENEEVIVIERE